MEPMRRWMRESSAKRLRAGRSSHRSRRIHLVGIASEPRSAPAMRKQNEPEQDEPHKHMPRQNANIAKRGHATREKAGEQVLRSLSACVRHPPAGTIFHWQYRWGNLARY